MITIFTSSCFFSLFGASRLFGNFPIAETVACCVYISVHIAVTATASVSSEALLGAGGGGDGGNIVMDMTAGYRNILAILCS